MKKCFILATVCCFGLLFSCQDDYDKSTPKTFHNADPNLKIAQKNLNDFMKFIEPNTRSSEKELNIIGVAKKCLPLRPSDSLMTPQTRSVFTEMKDSAYLYTFTFTRGEHKGYAIVSGEERVPKLYAYVEKGNIADTTINGGLKQALRMIDEIYQDEVVGAYVIGTKRQTPGISTYGNYTQSLTKLEWGQSIPYNLNVPFNCPGNKGGKALAGCVPAALSMVIASLEPIFAVQEDQVNTYNKFTHMFDDGSEQSNWVAKFVTKVGALCEVQYGCGGSSANTTGASKALSHYWIIHQVENGLNDNWTKNCLNNGYPIIAFGSPASGAGHCWLLDGGLKDASGKYTHFYNNWGYDGADNGYFAVTDFCRFTNPTTGAVSSYNIDNEFIYIFDVAK